MEVHSAHQTGTYQVNFIGTYQSWKNINFRSFSLGQRPHFAIVCGCRTTGCVIFSKCLLGLLASFPLWTWGFLICCWRWVGWGSGWSQYQRDWKLRKHWFFTDITYVQQNPHWPRPICPWYCKRMRELVKQYHLFHPWLHCISYWLLQLLCFLIT